MTSFDFLKAMPTHTQNTDEATTETFSSGLDESATDRPAAIASNRKFNIPGDTVRAAVRNLPEDQVLAILWLHSYGYDNNIPYKDLGAMLKQPDGSAYDGHTVWSVLSGRHQAKKDNFCKAILALKSLVEARATITRTGFIETALSRKIFQLCEASLIHQRPTLILGESQIGKTENLQEFARRHPNWLYLRMPTNGAFKDFISRLARARRISPQNPEVKDKIIESFDSNQGIIVDEMHQTFIRINGNSHKPLEFLREIWDHAKCGLVISGTNILDQEILNGVNKKILDQVRLRRLLTCRLPAKPTSKDLNIFAAHFGLAPAKAEALHLQSEIIRDDGLGRWLTILQAASRMAEKRKQSLTWDHVIAAHAAILKLEDPNQE
jgi:DNA transposition AAA+ family ATPase